MIDKLVLLLSTDWFRSYWSMIGINLDEARKSLLQEGCRKIVGQILSGAKTYWLTSFSEERKSETQLMLDSLIHKLGTREDVRGAIEVWTKTSDEDLKAGSLYAYLTEVAISADTTGDCPELSHELKVIVAGVRKREESTEVNFEKLSGRSRSAWDEYTRQLTPDLPTFVSDAVTEFVRVRNFETFWSTVRGELALEQREELIAWYRAAARSTARREIAPSFLS